MQRRRRLQLDSANKIHLCQGCEMMRFCLSSFFFVFVIRYPGICYKVFALVAFNMVALYLVLCWCRFVFANYCSPPPFSIHISSHIYKPAFDRQTRRCLRPRESCLDLNSIERLIYNDVRMSADAALASYPKCRRESSLLRL